MDRMQLLNQD